MMPSAKLETGQGGQRTDSVFDFLYHDGRRIASLLSQFDPSGHLTQLSRGTSAKKGTDSTSTLDGSASLPGIAKLENRNSETVTYAREDDATRVYDPTWSNARLLLDVLDERGLVQRDLKIATLGQVVLVKGEMAIYDLEILGGLWGLPSVKKLMANGVPKLPEIPANIRKTAAGRQLMDAARDLKQQAEMSLGLAQDMLPILPHSIQIRLTSSDGNNIWGSLRRDGMAMEASDIVLKHGLAVPGEWAVLGVLDAIKDEASGNNRGQTPDGSEMLAKLYETMAPLLRVMLGRPSESFGITPLLVFREVNT